MYFVFKNKNKKETREKNQYYLSLLWSAVELQGTNTEYYKISKWDYVALWGTMECLRDTMILGT